MGLKKVQIESVEIATLELKTAKERMPLVGSGEIPFDLVTQTAIPIRYDDIVLKTSAADTKNSNAASAVDALNLKTDELKNYQNSYFTIVFLKIKDGIYPVSILTSFGIPMTSRALPKNDSEMDMELQVTKMATGNAQIVALGLPLMVDYNYAHALMLMGQVTTLKNDKITKEALAVAGDAALVISFDLAKTLIDTMHAEEDFFYRLLEPAAFREAERNWGVIFEEEKVITNISIKSKMRATGADAVAPTWHIGKPLTARGHVATAGVIRTATAHAEVVLPTSQEGDLLLTGTCPGCVKISAPITVVAGEDQSLTFNFDLTPPEV